ncbi:MAG: hypothetical protein JSS51_12660 [Planctomycetes bacterium]|nr:hypothetical protein [Planctomycetota bacterium]
MNNADQFTNTVRPFTGRLVPIRYIANGETRAQAWYCVTAVAWSADGRVAPCSSIERCPLEATLGAIREARRHMARCGRYARRLENRKAVAS